MTPYPPQDRRRYCFTCKIVVVMTWCGNCSKIFCTNHNPEEHDFNEYSGISYSYFSHQACL